MQNNPVLVDIVRSPMARGKQGGALSELHPVDVLSQTIVALLERNQFDPGRVDDLIIGCVSQVGEQAVPPGRTAWRIWRALDVFVAERTRGERRPLWAPNDV
jgi:acetyl-CoA acyltransferase